MTPGWLVKKLFVVIISAPTLSSPSPQALLADGAGLAPPRRPDGGIRLRGAVWSSRWGGVRRNEHNQGKTYAAQSTVITGGTLARFLFRGFLFRCTYLLSHLAAIELLVLMVDQDEIGSSTTSSQLTPPHPGTRRLHLSPEAQGVVDAVHTRNGRSVHPIAQIQSQADTICSVMCAAMPVGRRRRRGMSEAILEDG